MLKTIPTRRSAQTTTTMKGIVSAMALSAETGVLAAGTYTRQVGLYDDDGGGDCVGVFELGREFAGKGVTGLSWGEEGRYLYISERGADVVQVYDIRGCGERVEVLGGRRAGTNARMGVEVLGTGEVVAGGMDGMVRVWGKGGGEAVGWWRAAEDPVNSAVMHPSGVVMATCSGERKTFGLPPDEDEEEPTQLWDNALRIWEIPYAAAGPKDVVDSTPVQPAPS